MFTKDNDVTLQSLTLIAAISENHVIGKNNNLPWHIPEDLKHFKRLTLGYPVIMGRKTFDSIYQRLGKPLPQRDNIILTRQENIDLSNLANSNLANVYVARIIQDALSQAASFSKSAFVIGGETVYRQTMDSANRLEITKVHREYEGDAYFPLIDDGIWEISKMDEKEGYSFITYLRK